MSELTTYFKLGYTHILDLAGYDHMLFLVALMAAYTFKQGRGLLVLITAFTIGHCMTLIVAGKGWFSVDSGLVEICIAVSIALTALFNLVNIKTERPTLRYMVALFFGLIHGLGFSGFLRALIGQEEVLWRPLLYFNLGVEFGQIVFVCLVLIINYLFVRYGGLKQRFWTIFMSLVALAWSLWMIFERM